MFVVVVTRKQTNNINLLTTVHQCTSLNEYLLSSPLLVHFLFHETLAEEMASTLNVHQKMADVAGVFRSIEIALEASALHGIVLGPKQVECIDHVLRGDDVLAILPTGYGKSLVFQLLPFLLPVKDDNNIVIVIAPLTSIISSERF